MIELFTSKIILDFLKFIDKNQLYSLFYKKVVMLSKLSIRQKIMLALGSVLILLSTLSIYDYFELKKMSKQVQALLDVEVQIEKDLTSWQTSIEKNIILTRALAIIDEPTIQTAIKKEMAETSEKVNQIQSVLEKNLYQTKSKELLSQVAHQRQIYSDTRKSFFDNKSTTDVLKSQKDFDATVQKEADTYISKVTALLTYEKQSTTTNQNIILNNISIFQNSLIFMTLVAILIGSIMCIIITNNIVRPIKQAIEFANNIAQGKLNSHIDNNSKDEIGDLVRSLHVMNDNLRTIVVDVRNGSGELFTSSSEISAGNTDLSQRTEAVAASLEEAAASIEEFTQSLTQTSENSSQANQMTHSAYTNAKKTGEEMDKFKITMQEINHSSSKIGDIISVIEGIAFQTNLLALNAAVEAARAGEHGRGFSVVATEVRNLSKRSSEAAKEIKDLINNSQEKVKIGTSAVAITSKNIENLISNIKNVNDIVSEINSSTKEQSDGIRQINEVISHIDESTQKNAALVEESSAATDSMKIQANSLNQLVNKFEC